MVQLHAELEQERSKNSALKSEIAKVRVKSLILSKSLIGSAVKRSIPHYFSSIVYNLSEHLIFRI